MHAQSLFFCALVAASISPAVAQNGNSALFSYISAVNSAVSIIDSIDSAEAATASPSSTISTSASLTTTTPAALASTLSHSTISPTSSAASSSNTAAAAPVAAASGLDPHTRTIIIAVCVVVGILLLLALILGCLFCCHRRRRRERAVTPVDDDEVNSWRGKRRSGLGFGRKEMAQQPATPLMGAGALAAAERPTTNRAQSLTARHRDNLNRQNPFVPAPPPTRKPVPNHREALEAAAAGAALGAGAYGVHKNHENRESQRLLNSHPGFEVRNLEAGPANTTALAGPANTAALESGKRDNLPTSTNADRPPTPFGLSGFGNAKDANPPGYDSHHGVEAAAGLGALGVGAAAAHHYHNKDENRKSGPPEYSGSSNYNSLSSNSTIGNYPAVRNGGAADATGAHVLPNEDQRYTGPLVQNAPSEGYAASSSADFGYPSRPLTAHPSRNALEAGVAGAAVGAAAMHHHNNKKSNENMRRMSGSSRRMSQERNLTASNQEYNPNTNAEIPPVPATSPVVANHGNAGGAEAAAGLAGAGLAASNVRKSKHRSLPLDNMQTDEYEPRQLRHTHRSHSPIQRPLSVRNGYPESVDSQNPDLFLSNPYTPDTYSGPYHNGAITTGNRLATFNPCNDVGAAGAGAVAANVARNNNRTRSQPPPIDTAAVSRPQQSTYQNSAQQDFAPTPTYANVGAGDRTITPHDSNPRMAGPLQNAHLDTLNTFSPSEEMRRSLQAREQAFSGQAASSARNSPISPSAAVRPQSYTHRSHTPSPPDETFLPPVLPTRSPRRSLDRPPPSPHRHALRNSATGGLISGPPGGYPSSGTDSDQSGDSWRSARADTTPGLPPAPPVPWSENYGSSNRRYSGDSARRRSGEARRSSGSGSGTPRVRHGPGAGSGSGNGNGNGNTSPYGFQYGGGAAGSPIVGQGERRIEAGRSGDRTNTMVRDEGFDFGLSQMGHDEMHR